VDTDSFKLYEDWTRPDRLRRNDTLVWNVKRDWYVG